MATHGDIWIPLDIEDSKNKMLYCEAWSDGYLDGVGLGAWCSSKKIKEIIQLNIMFAGSPFFYEPTQNQFVAKEGDYLVNGFKEYMGSNDKKYESLVESAKETYNLVLKNELEKAHKTEFGSLNLKKKLDLKIGINTYIRPFNKAWKDFIGKAKVLNLEEACEFVVNNVDDKNWDFCNSYFWMDGQFWVEAVDSNGNDDGNNATSHIIPLAFAHALAGDGTGCHGDTLGYIKDMTEVDHNNFLALFNVFKNKGLSFNKLFHGNKKICNILNSHCQSTILKNRVTPNKKNKLITL